MLFDLLCIVHCNLTSCDSKKGCRCFIFLLNFQAFISLYSVFCGFGTFKMVVVAGCLLGLGLVVPPSALSSSTSITMAERVELESDSFSSFFCDLLVVSVSFDILLLVQTIAINY